MMAADLKIVGHLEATARYLRTISQNFGTMRSRLFDPDHRNDNQGQFLTQQSFLSPAIKSLLIQQVPEVVRRIKENNLDSFKDYSIETNMDQIHQALLKEIKQLFLNEDGTVKQEYISAFAYEQNGERISGEAAIKAQFAEVPVDARDFSGIDNQEESVKKFGYCLINSYLSHCEYYLSEFVRLEIDYKGEHFAAFSVWHEKGPEQRSAFIEALKYSMPPAQKEPPKRSSRARIPSLSSLFSFSSAVSASEPGPNPLSQSAPVMPARSRRPTVKSAPASLAAGKKKVQYTDEWSGYTCEWVSEDEKDFFPKPHVVYIREVILTYKKTNQTKKKLEFFYLGVDGKEYALRVSDISQLSEQQRMVLQQIQTGNIPADFDFSAFLNSMAALSSGELFQSKNSPLKDSLLTGSSFGNELSAEEQPKKTLHQAVKEGDLETLQTLVLAGAALNEKDEHGNTPLYYAVSGAKEAALDILISAGADMNERDAMGTPLLHRMASAGKESSIRLLLKKGMDVNIRDNNGKTALFFATWDMIAIFLIKEGADVSVVDNEGKSVLHYATNKNIIHIFITHGANVALVSKLGQTVLHSAAADERIQAIHTLLAIKDGNEHSVVDINAVDEKGQTALSYSLIAGKFPAAIALIQAGAKLDEQTMQAKDVQQRSLLHYTAADKSLSGVMQQLIDAHVNVNAPDKKGRTPLHYAAKRGNLDAIIALRAAGADFNAVDHSGKTVLHYAAKKNQAAAIMVLAEQLTSENINQKDNKGLTALAYAFNEETETYQLEAAIVLLEAGAECSLRLLAQKEYNLDCKTLLHVAAAMNKPKTIHALITAGADVDAVDRYCQTALHCAVINKHMLAVKALIAANIDINAADSKGKTALHYAVQQGNQDMVALLISKGANIEAQDREGKTPLHYIAENSDIHSLIKRCNKAKEMDTKLLLHSAVFYQDKQLIALMIAEGSDIEERDEDGKTPLHYAAKTGDKEIVEFLISHGASVESKDKDGKTPLHYAVETGDENIITFLISRGANIEAKDKEGNTPLHDVAKQDNEKIFYLMFNESRRFKAKKIALEIAELKSRGYTDEDISYRVKTPIPGDIPIIGNVKNRTPLDYAGERIRRMESGRLLMRSYHTFLTECPEAVKDTHPGFKKLKKKFIAHTIGLKKIKPSEEHNQKLLEMCLELSCRLEYGSFYYKDKMDRLRNDDPARKKYQLHYGYALLLESLVDALSVRVSDDFKKRPQYQYLLKMLQLKRELTVAVSRGQDVKAKQVLLSQMVHFDNAVRHSGLSTSGQNKAYSVIREPLGENKNAQSVDAENTRNKKAGVSLKSVAGTFMAALRSAMTTHLVLAFPRVFAIPFGEKWVKQSQEDYANTKIQKPMADLLEAARSAEDLERDLIVVDSIYQPVSSEAQTGKVVRDFKDIVEDSRDEDIVPPAIGLAELEDSEGDVVRASSAVDTDVVPSGYNLQLASNDKGKGKADSRTIYFEVKDSHLHYSIMLASEEWFGGILKDIDMDEDNLNDAFLQQNYHRIVTEIETQMDETVIPTPPSSPSFEQKSTQLSLSAQRALTQTKKELSPLFTVVLPPDSPIFNRSNTSPLLAQGNPPSGCSSGDTLITVNPYQTPGLKAN